MTNPELILKLVEMLLAERDKNNQLHTIIEENKNLANSEERIINSE